MRRISFWILSTVSTLVLLFGYHTSTSSALAGGTRGVMVAGGAGGKAASSGSGSGTSTGTGTGTAATKGISTVTGAVAQTYWGPVQVRLTLDNGKITKVSVLQYPNGTSLDGQINAYALPILISETTKAQSAHIDMVSGATYTSTGYIQSLQSALDQAGI